MPPEELECMEIVNNVSAAANNDPSYDSFTQEVVKEAFGDELFTEHVKITLQNSDNTRRSADIYPSQDEVQQLSTFKRTYFGANKSQSVDENLIGKALEEISTNMDQGRTESFSNFGRSKQEAATMMSRIHAQFKNSVSQKMNYIGKGVSFVTFWTVSLKNCLFFRSLSFFQEICQFSDLIKLPHENWQNVQNQHMKMGKKLKITTRKWPKLKNYHTKMAKIETLPHENGQNVQNQHM